MYMLRILLTTWIFSSLAVNFILGETKNILYVKGFSMWLVRRMVAILDLLSRGAGGEAGCEGSLDK